MENARKPVVLEKIQLESKKVFFVNNRNTSIDERKSESKLFKEASLKRYSFYDRRNKLLYELPPHPKKILLPIFENQMIFISGVVLTLIHKDVTNNFQKNMIDFIIVRSLVCIFVLLFQLLELYMLNKRIKNHFIEENIVQNSDKKYISDKNKKLLILWMLISGLITVSQPIIEMLIHIKTISSFQLFTPITSLTLFIMLTFAFNKEKQTKIVKKNTLTDILNVDKFEIGKLINNEIDQHNAITRRITDNNITARQLLVVFLIFISLLIAIPNGTMPKLDIYGNNKGIVCVGIFTALIIPCLHDVLFHLICRRIINEFQIDDFLCNKTNMDHSLKDLSRRICNVYIHIFMTLGQIIVVFPVCLILRILMYPAFDGNLSTGEMDGLSFVSRTVVYSIFNLNNKELLTIIFSAVSMIGIYNRYRINNAETYGIVGLVTIQGFQTLLSTSMRHDIPLWLVNNLFSLVISIFSIFILKFHEIETIFKVILLYNRWFAIYKTERSDILNYISVDDYKKYYISNIRVIGGSVNLRNCSDPTVDEVETKNLVNKYENNQYKINSKEIDNEKIPTKMSLLNTPVNSAKVLLL